MGLGGFGGEGCLELIRSLAPYPSFTSFRSQGTQSVPTFPRLQMLRIFPTGDHLVGKLHFVSLPLFNGPHGEQALLTIRFT